MLRQAPPSALQQKTKSWASVSRQRGRASATAGENRAKQPGRATDTTNLNNNDFIDGADKRLAQSTQHTCAHLHKHATRTENTCLIPASAPGSCSLLVLTSFSSSSSSICLSSPLVVLFWILDVRFYGKWTKREIKRDVRKTRGRGREVVCVSTG